MRDNEANIIFSYSWQQGVEDGLLMRIDDLVPERPLWAAHTPILITMNCDQVLQGDRDLIRLLFAEYFLWKAHVEHTLSEEDRMFVERVRDQTVWIIPDGEVTTLLLPEDY